MKKFVYFLGITMVGFGFVIIFLIGFAGVISTIFEDGIITAIIIAGISCLIGIPLIFFGMRCVHFAEKNNTTNISRTNNNRSLKYSTKYFEQNWKSKITEFDLSRLNIWGWFVFLSTALFIILTIWLMVNILEIDTSRRGKKIYGAIALFLGLGYYKIVTIILDKLKINIFHDIKK